ncbi:hypothetical protein HII31_00403 [Pseudocercospora fuligena]|uniref:Uncharacterized protein n=1 Tax=Pseudocercospora fuligena TaxID=685502 RepID=A0A8H6RWS6_9PEZI|nr:hypothetical protein HII31_00403 [Pseudocercospora fuligena]
MDTDTHLLAVWLKIFLEKSELSCKVDVPHLAAQTIRFWKGRKFVTATLREFERLLIGMFDVPATRVSQGMMLAWYILECMAHHAYDPRFISPPLQYGDTFPSRSTDRERKTRPVRVSKARAQRLIYTSLKLQSRTGSTQRNARSSHTPAVLRRQNVSFFTMPKEIRTMIYMETILPNGNPRVISVTEPFEPKKPIEAKVPSLAQTSQLIRAEIFELLPQFYRLNTFNVTSTIKADAKRACAWLDTIPSSCRIDLTKLVMTDSVLRNEGRRFSAGDQFRYTINMDRNGKVIHYHRALWPQTRSNPITEDGKKFFDNVRGLQTNIRFFKRRIMQAAGGRYINSEDSKTGVACRDFHRCGGDMDTDWIFGG